MKRSGERNRWREEEREKSRKGGREGKTEKDKMICLFIGLSTFSTLLFSENCFLKRLSTYRVYAVCVWGVTINRIENFTYVL